MSATAIKPTSPRTIQPSKWSAWKWLRLLCFSGLFFGLGFEIVRMTAGTNWHTVLPGKVYRSAQPDASLLRWAKENIGLRSVLNLRSGSSGLPFFDQETEACEELGIELHHFEFSAIRLPQVSEIRRLVHTMESAPQPLLLHCKQGADRTGLAAVIAQILIDDIPYAQAKGQLSIRYTHLNFGPTRQMDRFFSLYEDWLSQTQQTHNQAVFRHWLLEGYHGADNQYAREEVVPLQSEAEVGKPVAYRVRYRNTSQAVWHFKAIRSGGIHGVYAIGDWRRPDAQWGRAGFMDKDVGPGQTVEVTYVLPPFTKAGKYRIYLDLVEEGHAHFGQVGAEPFEEEIAVRE